MNELTPQTPCFSQIGLQIPSELLMKLATVGLILIATWAVSIIVGRSVSRAVGKLSPRVAQQAKRIVMGLVWLIGVLIGLEQLGLDLTILLVILTLGGITLSISLRDVLPNVASHEVITTYSLFKIGDWIQVGKCFGRVVDITWMDTVLMTPDNEMLYIPNSKITKSIVTNRTAPGETRISVSLTVDDNVDLSEVEKILLETGAELKEELAPDSKPEVRVTNVDSHAIRLALLLKVNNPAKSTLIASEVRKRAKMRIERVRRKASH
jgi:small conductance mechanosensitive channel